MPRAASCLRGSWPATHLVSCHTRRVQRTLRKRFALRSCTEVKPRSSPVPGLRPGTTTTARPARFPRHPQILDVVLHVLRPRTPAVSMRSVTQNVCDLHPAGAAPRRHRSGSPGATHQHEGTKVVAVTIYSSTRSMRRRAGSSAARAARGPRRRRRTARGSRTARRPARTDRTRRRPSARASACVPHPRFGPARNDTFRLALAGDDGAIRRPTRRMRCLPVHGSRSSLW